MNLTKITMTALAIVAVTSCVTATAADITGAGATFPYPIYSAWAAAYKTSTGVGMNYQSIGSGGGIKQIQSKTVDFGASDAPLKPDELEKSGLKAEVAEVTMKAMTESLLTGEDAAKMQKLMDALEALDDVQEVFTSAVFDG